MKFSLALLIFGLLSFEALTFHVHYDIINPHYRERFGVDMPTTVSGVTTDDNTFGKIVDFDTMSERDTENFIAEVKRICGTDQYYSEYDVQRLWRTVYLETRGDGVQNGELYFLNASTGQPTFPGVPLSGEYNGSLICTAGQGCIGEINRVIDFFGAPIPNATVEQTILVFKSEGKGAPTEMCVLNTDVTSGIYNSRPIGRNVQHPDALLSMDATISGVGGTQGPDAGLNFNWWQVYQVPGANSTFENVERIRTIVWGIDNSGLGTKDAATFLISLIIDYTLS
jgi:hypothetical protein